MNFLKALFGGKEESSEERKHSEEERNFNLLKFDGIKALRMNQMEHATKCFQHALQIKDDLELRDYLSQALIHLGELEEATRQLDILAEAQPDNVQIPIRIANVAFMNEDYDTMSAACQRAIDIDPANPQTYYLFAHARIKQGNPSEAIALLSKAIDLNADYGDAILLRGETLLQTDQTEEAVKDADYLIQHTQQNEDVLLLKARIEQKMGNTDEALIYYNKVVDANPFSLDAYKERAALHQLLGNTDEAEADLKQVADLTPTTTDGQTEDLEQKVRDAYRNNNPFGLG